MRNLFRAASRITSGGTMGYPRLRGSLSPYAGASHSRLHGDWNMGSVSADQAMTVALQILKNRARDLVANDPNASRVPALFAENVIGKDGVVLQAAFGTTRGGIANAVNRRLEDAWYRWCEPRYCMVDRKMSWPDLENLTTETLVADGEVLIRKVEGFDNPFGYAVDLLDTDQLDVAFNRPPRPNAPEGEQNEVRMGVEVDAWGGAVAYHLWANHPSEIGRGRKRLRVPADQIIHYFVPRRAKQTRGLTWFASSIVTMKMLSGYREAELVAARAAAAKMGFFEWEKEALAHLDVDEDSAKEEVPLDAAPGTYEILPPGLRYVANDPQHPTSAFQHFDQSILRSLATGFRVSYMALSSDLSDTSYSSGRLGALAERAVYQQLQERHIAHVSQPTYRSWLRMALTTGALALDTMSPERYEAVLWQPRSFPWVDPQKDIEAAAREVAMGIQSLTRLAAERGRDFAEIVAERAEEIRLTKELGVPIDLGLRGRPAPNNAASDDSPDDGADTDDDDDSTEGRRGLAAAVLPLPRRRISATSGGA